MTGYRFGSGIADITGPAAECGMMGYSMIKQRTNGIHMRLRSRAFIIGEGPCRIVFVTAEIGMIFQGVSLAVLQALRQRYGGLYTEENVCLTATHTHAGPGGYSHYALYNLGTLGYDEGNFRIIVDGIVTSIERAHRQYEARDPGVIRIITGEVEHVGFNRSPEAYERNPRTERDTYGSDISKTMTLLRFEDAGGNGVATLNWLPLHPTNLGNTNTLISPDNKGYAAWLFEKEMGTDHREEGGFVAGFAQSECGDVSPNIWGYPDGINDFWRMKEIGRRQYVAARRLYGEATEELRGPLDCRHRYLEMANILIDPRWIQDGVTGDSGPVRTCPAAIGISKVAGSSEDGRGLRFIPEGMTFGGTYLPDFIVDRAIQECHREKAILLVTGKTKPHPWTPQVLPAQLLRIGQLGMIALPSECTTMAARRLKEAVRIEMPDLRYLIVACYANAYAGYITTREEYAAQHYEGASVHFGPYTLNAWQQECNRLAAAMHAGAPVAGALQPPDLSDVQVLRQPGVIVDAKPLFKRWGSVYREPKKQYIRGETAEAVFRGAHPRNDFMTQDSFLFIERAESGTWTVIARDEDPETIFKWERHGIAASLITIRWIIPFETSPGIYRIRHTGYRKGHKRYEGVSRGFEVT
ncbi:MAG: neutral/alkaline ceramidase [Bacteroidetes bacterium]|nr:neutral/alkaline ceramidase [Bacteroidota bacterium]